MTIRAAILVALVSCAGLAEKRAVTLDDVTATRAPRAGSGNIHWAPDGKRFAYQQRSAIWQYDVASGSRKEIVSLAALRQKAVKPPAAETFDWQNRRVSESSYQWSNSGAQMLVEAEGDLFLVETGSGEWTQLTSTAETERDPKLSPDGKRVAFRRSHGHDLYSLDIASRKEARLTHDGSATLLNGQLDWVYPEELDLGTAFWWSPDSSRIAYLQLDVSREPEFPQADLLHPRAVLEPERYPQPGDPNADVRVGVVPAGGGSTRWMDLGETRDFLIARVDWTPSGMLAVQRLNRVQNRLDLMVADPATGSAVLLLREQDPYWVDVTDTYRFLKDGKRLLWSSARDGFRHLYLYSMDGKEIHTVTRGDWEVSALACVDEGAKTIYYTSTEKSPLERHLYRVGFDGKHSSRLTETGGTHAISMSPGCEYYLDSESSLTSLPQRTLRSRDGKQVAVYMEQDRTVTDQLEILPTEILKVKADDGDTLYARLIKPAGFEKGKKYPAVVMIYGGPHAQTVRDSWVGATWDQALAARGFVIWQLDNRGSAGRGHRWESRVFHALGAKELEDQKTGVRYLTSLGFVDPARVGIFGWSYGGFMTLYCLSHAPELFRAGIAGAPVTDWRNYDTIYTERYMGLPGENSDGYARSSVVAKASDITARLMLVHNYSDDNVHFSNTLQMAEALERAGKQFEMKVYTEKTHAVTGAVRRQMLEGLTEFLERNLK